MTEPAQLRILLRLLAALFALGAGAAAVVVVVLLLKATI